MESKNTAAELLAAMRSGDSVSFSDILNTYQLPVTRYLYRLTGDYEIARDLAQDTFIKVYKNIEKTKTDLKLQAWIYRIATNTAFQHHRRKKIIRFIPFETMTKTEPGGNRKNPYDPVEGMAIKETLENIPYKLRICVVLYYVEGFKCWEIAETLGISETAVRKRISRGAGFFRKLYDGGNEK